MSRQAPHSEHTEIRARTAEFLANGLLEPLPDGLRGSLLHKPTMMQNMGQSVSRARQPGSQADLAPTHSTAGASSTRGQSCQAGPKGWAEEPQCLTQQSRDMPTGAKVGRNAGSPASSTRQRARRLRQPEPKAAQGTKPFRKPNPKAAESPESAPPTNRRRLQIHAHTRDASPSQFNESRCITSRTWTPPNTPVRRRGTTPPFWHRIATPLTRSRPRAWGQGLAVSCMRAAPMPSPHPNSDSFWGIN